MIRLRALSGIASLMLLATPALAQEAGGVPLTPEVLNIPDAQQQAMNLALGLLQRAQLAQQLQQGRFGQQVQGVPVQAPVNPNAVNPSADRSATNQQAIARLRGDAGFLGGFSGGQALALSRAKPMPVPVPTIVDQSQTLVVNAVDSPVALGNGNIIHQQVANSTAISHGAPATASAGTAQRGKGRKSGATVAQDADSTAVSTGGIAAATASNSNTVQR